MRLKLDKQKENKKVHEFKWDAKNLLQNFQKKEVSKNKRDDSGKHNKSAKRVQKS